MEQFLAIFLRDVLGLKAPDFSEEFSEDRARDAWQIVDDTAKESVAMREATPNTFGFFPRVSLRDHADIELLRPLVHDRTAELREALLSAAGKYALGSEVLTLGELQEIRGEYMATARLSLALDAEHKRWHAEQSEIREAAQRASGAYSGFMGASTPEQNDEALAALREKLTGEPAPLTGEQAQGMASSLHYYGDVLDSIAQRTPEVVAELQAGRKIHAIKALRVLTRCGLKEAKESCDRILAAWNEER